MDFSDGEIDYEKTSNFEYHCDSFYGFYGGCHLGYLPYCGSGCQNGDCGSGYNFDFGSYSCFGCEPNCKDSVVFAFAFLNHCNFGNVLFGLFVVFGAFPVLRYSPKRPLQKQLRGQCQLARSDLRLDPRRSRAHYYYCCCCLGLGNPGRGD